MDGWTGCPAYLSRLIPAKRFVPLEAVFSFARRVRSAVSIQLHLLPVVRRLRFLFGRFPSLYSTSSIGSCPFHHPNYSICPLRAQLRHHG